MGNLPSTAKLDVYSFHFAFYSRFQKIFLSLFQFCEMSVKIF